MKTALWDRHVALGAKMVDFSGWEMPVQYKGILQEHQAVRRHAGLFDVSHMARVAVRGPDAARFFEWIATNRLKGNHSATYTCFCDERGGSVDDAIIYKESDSSLFVILNASRREADLQHFRQQASFFEVHLEECYKKEGILSLQGPEASRYLPLVPPMTFERRGDLIISGTGYTGSGGVEIFGPTHSLIALWDQLIAAGVEPIGLGARDTLRLEKGYALYGHELSSQISPIESVSAWTIHKDKDFLGKEALKNWSRKAYAIRLNDPAIPREGFKVFSQEEEIGYVTSGGFSPSLKTPIALILSKNTLNQGDLVYISIRERKVPATLVPLPFI